MRWRVKLRFRTGIRQGRRTLIVAATSGAHAAWIARRQFQSDNRDVKQVTAEEAVYLGPPG